MSTIWDFITIAIFAGLIVLFLQRSMADEPPSDDPLWRYLLAAVGCAITNYLGNEISGVAAAVALVGTILFILYELRPLPQFPRR